MSELLTKNAVKSLLDTSLAGLTTVNFAIALLDLLILETSHYAKADDVIDTFKFVRADLNTYAEEIEND